MCVWLGSDYTLDYNYEASYYGVYASGHPELTQLYWQPIIDGVAPALRGAVSRAARALMTLTDLASSSPMSAGRATTS